MPSVAAKPRSVDGVMFDEPLQYLVAAGFDKEQAQTVVNAYKRYYGKAHRGDAYLPSTWLAYVIDKTGVDEAVAMAIMRRYRKFYGK